MLGYSGAVVFLLLAQTFVERRAYKKSGGDAAAGDAATEKFQRDLLRAFGVKLEHEKGTEAWSYALVALLPALAAFFLADWFLTSSPPHAVTCDRPAEACAASASSSGAEHGFLNENGTRCCVAVETTYKLTIFLAGIGGNIISGYTFVKGVAKFLLWSEGDNVKVIEQDGPAQPRPKGKRQGVVRAKSGVRRPSLARSLSAAGRMTKKDVDAAIAAAIAGERERQRERNKSMVAKQQKRKRRKKRRHTELEPAKTKREGTVDAVAEGDAAAERAASPTPAHQVRSTSADGF